MSSKLLVSILLNIDEKFWKWSFYKQLSYYTEYHWNSYEIQPAKILHIFFNCIYPFACLLYTRTCMYFDECLFPGIEYFNEFL